MSRTRLSILFGSLLLIFTIVVWVVILRWAQTAPTALEGDPWDYAVQLADVPADWTLAQHDITTAFDLEQSRLEAAAMVTGTDSLSASGVLTDTGAMKNVTQMYSVRFDPPETSPYVYFTCQVILYQSYEDAQAALRAENPGGEWESADVPQKQGTPSIGDEARLWHFKNPDPSVSQNIYRLDFRYLNGIASLTLMGTGTAVPDATEVVTYAGKIFDRMKKNPAPADFKNLRSAGLPDLRRFLLTQAQVAQADSSLGNRWAWATEQLPTWTPTNIMSEGAQKALAPLGRVTGYQMYYYKSVSQNELKSTIPILIFQQVTAYKEAGNAQKGLDMMKGITQLPEFSNPPQIGDGQTHAWRGELSSTQSDGTKVMVAVSELDFRVGNYVASVKLQSRPLSDNEISRADPNTNIAQAGVALLQVMQLNETLANKLVENLRTLTK